MFLYSKVGNRGGVSVIPTELFITRGVLTSLGSSCVILYIDYTTSSKEEDVIQTKSPNPPFDVFKVLGKVEIA